VQLGKPFMLSFVLPFIQFIYPHLCSISIPFSVPYSFEAYSQESTIIYTILFIDKSLNVHINLAIRFGVVMSAVNWTGELGNDICALILSALIANTESKSRSQCS
jgi:hypothetical protein